MPVQVYVEVNGRPVQSIHIANVGETDTPGVYDYLVLSKPARGGTPVRSPHYDPDLPSNNEWDDKGVPFTHVREDGITVCVEKALHALTNN